MEIEIELIGKPKTIAIPSGAKNIILGGLSLPEKADYPLQYRLCIDWKTIKKNGDKDFDTTWVYFDGTLLSAEMIELPEVTEITVGVEKAEADYKTFKPYQNTAVFFYEFE
ncbi:MAG: hypothetical protein M0D57_04485 [Sphingobacteriales bacterium JAD_PAG50586_3]|nr:MAG: hypothetical protein M0D57_04485 [Sphingobacteriales bacterium JAD_PAG50586_3]